MTTSKPEADVISFPKPSSKKSSSTERIWGKAVYSHGYAGIPSILIQAQRRLGINSMQMNIIIQLLDYWFDPSRKPFPMKEDLAKRIGVTAKTIQTNIAALEKAGLSSGRCARRLPVTGIAISTISTALLRRFRRWSRNLPPKRKSEERPRPHSRRPPGCGNRPKNYPGRIPEADTVYERQERSPLPASPRGRA
jgi:hypothetical protein